MNIRLAQVLAGLLLMSSMAIASVPTKPSGVEQSGTDQPTTQDDLHGNTAILKHAQPQLTQPPSFTALPVKAQPLQPDRSAQIVNNWGRIPLSFEANIGQTAEEVKYFARGPGYTVFLTPTETVLSLRRAGGEQRQDRLGKMHIDPQSLCLGCNQRNPLPTAKPKLQPIQGAVIRMKLEGANAQPLIEGAQTLPGKVNYFHGDDPRKWHTGIPTYRQVRYKNIYPGIDVAYYGNPRQLEHDFIVAPGADPGRIRIAFEGLAGKSDAPALHLTEGGDLALAVSGGEVLMQKPRVYQEVEGHQVEVEAQFVLHSQGEGVGLATAQPVSVGFKLAAYDPKLPVVIDPVVVYSTYLGGSDNESVSSIAVDSSGNAYVTGATGSSDFPSVHAKYQNLWGGQDAYVFKLSSDGQTVIYSTYLGGSSSIEGGSGVAVDGNGNAYVTGYTYSSDFPKVHAKYSNLYGPSDAFIFKLSADGQTVIYSTYLGGSSTDGGSGIAVDGSGNAYVTGETDSNDFPKVHAKYSSLYGSSDAFIFKLSGDGQTVIYSTYLGGSSTDNGSGIAVDSSGNAYVTGTTRSSDFPKVHAKYSDLYGYSDAFIFKLSNDGQTVIYSTYLGGSDIDYGTGIAVDGSGNAYVTGYTISDDFPKVHAKYSKLHGTLDAFIFKLSSDGQSVRYSTYLGGSADDVGLGIAVDSSGNAYATGITYSTDFPKVNAMSVSSGGSQDAFVFKLSSDGQTVLYSTYLGGSDGDDGIGIAVDGSGNAYVTGTTRSSDFPNVHAKYQDLRGPTDAFVVKITDSGSGIFGDPNIAAGLKGVLDTPQPLEGELLPSLVAPNDNRKRNVVVLVHGWHPVWEDTKAVDTWGNDTKAVLESRLAAKLCSNSGADPCWEVAVADWEADAKTLLPFGAYLNGPDVGSALANELANKFKSKLNHLHLVGHSAGSKVIHEAARTFAQYKKMGYATPKSVQMTFLDPFTPSLLDFTEYGDLDPGLIPNFSESYVTDYPPPKTLADLLLSGTAAGDALEVASYYIWINTAFHLTHAYNFGVSALDTNAPTTDPLTWAIQDHAWPYQFYQCSVNPSSTDFVGKGNNGSVQEPCPDGHNVYAFGFPLSLESDQSDPTQTVQGLRQAYLPGHSCWATSTTKCDGLGTLVKQKVDSIVNGVVDLTNTVVSDTGKAVIWIGDTAYDLGQDLIQSLQDANSTSIRLIQKLELTTGSPVWVRMPVTIADPANYLRFKFKFTQEAQGYLRAFIHGKQIWSADQRTHATGQIWEAEVGIGDVEPGTYEIAFRLDPLTDTQAAVELTNFEIGQIKTVDAPNVVPIANAGPSRTVRLGSLVTLDGGASYDPDKAPSPLSYAWTQTGGPAAALSQAASAKPAFTPGSKGTYRFSLTVGDGAATSSPATVDIKVPLLGDIDLDGDVDNNDLNIVVAARNQPANGPNDLRDLDGNGKIDALDARKLTTLCTRARCATQ